MKRRRPGLFYEYWYSLDGTKLRKATKAELTEAYRLWVVHADIREGMSRGDRPGSTSGQGLTTGFKA
jgi:hypothetical protein